VSVDDALLLFDLSMATKLPARAGRDEEKAKLKSLPRAAYRPNRHRGLRSGGRS
jgi:hypothetical protein